MKQILSITAAVMIAAILGTSSIAPYVDADRGHDKPIVLRFIGDGTLLTDEEKPILDGLDPEIQAMILDPDTLCYEIPLERMKNGKIIGTGLDCLANIEPEGDSITLTDVTIFNIKKKVLVSVSEVTIQPNLTADTENVTHITGSFPAENNIVYGTKKFEDASGSVRLSGGVNMSDFPEKIVFDCIFVINLDKN